MILQPLIYTSRVLNVVYKIASTAFLIGYLFSRQKETQRRRGAHDQIERR